MAVLVLSLQRSTAGRPQQLGRRLAGVHSSPFPPWSHIKSGQTPEQAIQPHKPVTKALPLTHGTRSNHTNICRYIPICSYPATVSLHNIFLELMYHLFPSSMTEFCVEMGVVVKKKFQVCTCRFATVFSAGLWFVRVMPNFFSSYFFLRRCFVLVNANPDCHIILFRPIILLPHNRFTSWN